MLHPTCIASSPPFSPYTNQSKYNYVSILLYIIYRGEIILPNSNTTSLWIIHFLVWINNVFLLGSISFPSVNII